MKNTFNTLSLFVFLPLLWGCKETTPAIDLSEKVYGLVDTTYVTGAVPAPVNKMIFVEEITGVHCKSCPIAAMKAHQIDSANPSKSLAMAVHPFAFFSLTNAWPGFEVLNTSVGDDIFEGVYNSPTGLPGGGINRKKFPGETIALDYKNWPGFADMIKTEESPVLLTSELIKLDPIANKARIKIKVTFSKKYDTLAYLYLSVYLTESKIISKQTMPDGFPIDNYEHNHVLRKAITPFNGLALKINATTIGNYEAGRVFEKEFETDLDPKWKKENCAFVILVNRFDEKSKEVIQAGEQELQ